MLKSCAGISPLRFLPISYRKVRESPQQNGEKMGQNNEPLKNSVKSLKSETTNRFRTTPFFKKQEAGNEKNLHHFQFFTFK